MKRDSFDYRILAKMLIITEAGGGYIGLNYIIHPTFVYLKISITKSYFLESEEINICSLPPKIYECMCRMYLFNMKIFLKIH